MTEKEAGPKASPYGEYLRQFKKATFGKPRKRAGQKERIEFIEQGKPADISSAKSGVTDKSGKLGSR